jgi:putative nucleotidyltransferase with HDIG domain
LIVGPVVLVSDQPKRSLPLSETLRGVAACEVVAPDVQWTRFPDISAVVTDLDFARAAAIRCLIDLRLQPWPKPPPLLCVSHRISDKALRQAQALGASACLPFYSEPHVVVTALLNLLNPGQGKLNASLRQCAAHAAAALDKAFLAAERSSRVDLEAVDACVDPLLSALREGGLARWLNTIQAHDTATYQHSLVVAGLAAQFSAQISFPEVQRRRLVRAALVHDIGKAQIPRTLLLKRGALEPDEAVLMRTHVVHGYEILRASRGVEPVMLDAVRHHHELLDGSGYPDGLRGEAISDVVRFLTICDIYAALTERRSYKQAMTSGEAMAVLQAMSGKVEPGFLQAFGRAVARAA